MIRELNLGTWAGGEQVVQPTVPSRSVSVMSSFRRRGHLLMAKENVKGW